MHQNKKKNNRTQQNKIWCKILYSSKYTATHTVIWDFHIYSLHLSCKICTFEILCFWYILQTEKDITLGEKTQNIVRVNVASSSNVL